MYFSEAEIPQDLYFSFAEIFRRTAVLLPEYFNKVTGRRKPAAEAYILDLDFLFIYQHIDRCFQTQTLNIFLHAHLIGFMENFSRISPVDIQCFAGAGAVDPAVIVMIQIIFDPPGDIPGWFFSR